MKRTCFIALCAAVLTMAPATTALATSYDPGYVPFGPGAVPAETEPAVEETLPEVEEPTHPYGIYWGMDVYANPNPLPPEDTDTVDYPLPVPVLIAAESYPIKASQDMMAEDVINWCSPYQMFRYIDENENFYHILYDGKDAYLPKEAGHTISSIKLPQGLNVRAQLVLNAFQYLGSLYKYGGTGANGFDCSYFTLTCYKSIGVNIPRTTKTQVNFGTPIDVSQIRPGDLVFYSSGGTEATVNHVAMYIGGGLLIHAKNTGNGVCVDPYAMRQDLPFRIVNVLGDQN